MRLPLVGAPYTLRMDPRIAIAAGFQRIEAGLLHITAGLGHTIPLRFGCPPEVVWLGLRADRRPLADARPRRLLLAVAGVGCDQADEQTSSSDWCDGTRPYRR